MKRLFLFSLLLLTLAACSARTLLVTDVDVLSFVNAADLEGDLTVPGSVQLFVPDADGDLLTPDGGRLVDQLPVLDALSGFAVRVTVEVENTGGGALQVAAEFRLAPASDSTDIYDGVQDLKLAETGFQLDPGARRTITLEAELTQGDAGMELITQDGFRVGMKIAATGASSVHYRITGFDLQLKQRPFDLIPSG